MVASHNKRLFIMLAGTVEQATDQQVEPGRSVRHRPMLRPNAVAFGVIVASIVSLLIGCALGWPLLFCR
jgi:hypothetical protein